MTMTVIHGKRLLKLADKLETVPRKELTMGSWWQSQWNEDYTQKTCQTAGCALGWAGTMPEFIKLGLVTHKLENYVCFNPVTKLDCQRKQKLCEAGIVWDDDGFDAAEVFFGLTQKEAARLFAPRKGNRLPQSVANNIRRLVKSYHPELLQSKGE